jgi:hypothetical protein
MNSGAVLEPKVELEEASQTGQGEPVNLVDLEDRILQLCSETQKGITYDMIRKDQPSLDVDRMVRALQRLLSQVYGAKGSV